MEAKFPSITAGHFLFGQFETRMTWGLLGGSMFTVPLSYQTQNQTWNDRETLLTPPPPERKRRKIFPWKLKGMTSPWIKKCFLFGGVHSFIFKVPFVYVEMVFSCILVAINPGPKNTWMSHWKPVKGWDQWEVITLRNIPFISGWNNPLILTIWS